MAAPGFAYARLADKKHPATVSSRNKNSVVRNCHSQYDNSKYRQYIVNNQSRLTVSDSNYVSGSEYPSSLNNRNPVFTRGKFAMGGLPPIGMLPNVMQGFTTLNPLLQVACAITHPIGIASTSSKGFLTYGADFTHQLMLSQGGVAGCLQGTQVSEQVNVSRDDFRFQKTYGKGFGSIPLGQVIWTLGVRGSRVPGEFTDRIETPHNLVLYTMEKYRPTLPARRDATQNFYWRRHQYGVWRKFATVKIYFMVDKYRGNLYAWTISNNDVVAENWAYRRPRGY